VTRRTLTAVVAVASVGAVVGGLVPGVATTSAAWTDDAWVTAAASAGTVDLRGSDDGATWTAAGGTVVLAPVTGLVPGAAVERTVHLWNASSVPLALTWADAPATLLDGCVEVTYSSLAGVRLAADPAADPTRPADGSVTTATATFRVPPGAAASCSGRSLDDVRVTVQGSPA